MNVILNDLLLHMVNSLMASQSSAGLEKLGALCHVASVLLEAEVGVEVLVQLLRIVEILVAEGADQDLAPAR